MIENNVALRILERDLQIQIENKALPDGIEAIKVAIQAIQKQIAQKPYHISNIDDNEKAYVECPICHATTDFAINIIKKGHCWKCGQLLDWLER